MRDVAGLGARRSLLQQPFYRRRAGTRTAHYALVESLCGRHAPDRRTFESGRRRRVRWTAISTLRRTSHPASPSPRCRSMRTLDAVGAVPTKEVATQRASRRARRSQGSSLAAEPRHRLPPSSVCCFSCGTPPTLVCPERASPVALILGLGTMLLPFSTAYFAHVLSAALGFAAFALVLCRREARDSPSPRRGSSPGWPSLRRRRSRLWRWHLRPGCSSTGRGSNGAASMSPDSVGGSIPLLAYNAWAF